MLDVYKWLGLESYAVIKTVIALEVWRCVTSTDSTVSTANFFILELKFGIVIITTLLSLPSVSVHTSHSCVNFRHRNKTRDYLRWGENQHLNNQCQVESYRLSSKQVTRIRKVRESERDLLTEQKDTCAEYKLMITRMYEEFFLLCNDFVIFLK